MTIPQIMRIDTERGEATLIIANHMVEHASPNIAWALGMSLPGLLRRLVDLEWPAVWVSHTTRHGAVSYAFTRVI